MQLLAGFFRTLQDTLTSQAPAGNDTPLVVVLSAGSSIAAQHFVGSPWHVSIGAAAGILAAVLMPPGARQRKRR